MERTLTWLKYKRCTLINIPHSFLSFLCCLYCHCFIFPIFTCWLWGSRLGVFILPKGLRYGFAWEISVFLLLPDSAVRDTRGLLFFLLLISSFRLIQTHCYLLWVSHCLNPLWIILKILSSAWLVLFVPLHKNVIECYMNEPPLPSPPSTLSYPISLHLNTG